MALMTDEEKEDGAIDARSRAAVAEVVHMYTMAFHAEFWSDILRMSIVRVPGGWMYRGYDVDNDWLTGKDFFVPWTEPPTKAVRDQLKLRADFLVV